MIPSPKDVCDLVSLCLAAGAWMSWLTLPNIAAIISILWTLWRAGETVYGFLRRKAAEPTVYLAERCDDEDDESR